MVLAELALAESDHLCSPEVGHVPGLFPLRRSAAVSETQFQTGATLSEQKPVPRYLVSVVNNVVHQQIIRTTRSELSSY